MRSTRSVKNWKFRRPIASAIPSIGSPSSASAVDEQQPRSGIRDVMWVKEPVQQLGTIAYDRPPVDAGPVTSRDAILGNANAFTAAKNRDCGGARPTSVQNAGPANEIGRCSFRCSNNNNSNNGRCTLPSPFPDPRLGTRARCDERTSMGVLCENT